HRRGTARADNPVRRHRHLRLSPLGRSDDHAHPGRCGVSLRSADRRGGVHAAAGLPVESQSGVLAVLAGGAAGGDRAVRARWPDGRPDHAARPPRKSPGMSAVLRTEGLSKSFGAIRANADVSLSFAAGARHALIGPNGAGKTTFINLLTGSLRPSSGEVYLGEERVTALP